MKLYPYENGEMEKRESVACVLDNPKVDIMIGGERIC